MLICAQPWPLLCAHAYTHHTFHGLLLVWTHSYTGFCELGVGWQTLESTDLKMAVRMPSHVTGVYVTALEPCYHAAQVGGCMHSETHTFCSQQVSCANSVLDDWRNRWHEQLHKSAHQHYEAYAHVFISQNTLWRWGWYVWVWFSAPLHVQQ